MQDELNKYNNIEKEQQKANKEIDVCLSQMKDLGDQLKNDKSYKQFGYVVKQDLINVYKKNKENTQESDDDVLLLIQAPQGTEIKIPCEQIDKHDTNAEKGQKNSQESNFSRNYQLFINAPNHSHLRYSKPTLDQQIHVKCIPLSDQVIQKEYSRSGI